MFSADINEHNLFIYTDSRAYLIGRP